MTDRLFYEDAYTTRFHATVVESLRHEGKAAVVLDRTYFYPTSGGQPADQGQLGNRAVVDVFLRDADGVIVHVLDGVLALGRVEGRVDWHRRFDHMQHHTGQHILSASFLQVADAATVGFHLSENSVTIDLDRPSLEPQAIEEAELLANRIVWEDRTVHIRMLTADEVDGVELRKVPEVGGDLFRLVAVEEFDLTACGGTHVARTGSIGLIKITGVERISGGTRISFLCGRRALVDYHEKHEILTRLAGQFTTGYWELERVTAALQEDAREAHRRVRRQQEQLARHEARRLAEEAPHYGEVRLVRRLFQERDSAALRQLANALAEHAGVVALLALASPERTQLIFARAEDASGDMNALIRSALEVLGGGGGGSPSFAQGGGPPAEEALVQKALARAESSLLSQLGS